MHFLKKKKKNTNYLTHFRVNSGMKMEVCLLQNDAFTLPIEQHICFLMVSTVKSVWIETRSHFLPSASQSQSRKGNKTVWIEKNTKAKITTLWKLRVTESLTPPLYSFNIFIISPHVLDLLCQSSSYFLFSECKMPVATPFLLVSCWLDFI